MFIELRSKMWYWLKKKIKVHSWNSFKVNIRRKIEKNIYRKKYSTEDIISLMKSMGLKKGSTVFVHSSWDEFYNYTGTIIEFIDAMLAEIGPEGTLAMPAYPLLTKANSVFKIKSTPTAAGWIAEEFRNYPNVKRSVDRHSVCAVGPNSDYLLAEHQYSITCWDEKSPYYKLGEINALIFSFGLGKYFPGTSWHCAKSILKDEIPFFNQFFQKRVKMQIELEDGNRYIKESLEPNDTLRLYNSPHAILKIQKKYFDKSKYKQTKISNLSVNVHDANYLIHKVIELGRKGIVQYKPTPSKNLFNL